MRGILNILRTLKKSGMGKNVLRAFQSHVDQQIQKYASDGEELADWLCLISDVLGEPWPLGEKLMCNLDITKEGITFTQRNIYRYLDRTYPNHQYPECFNRIIRPCSVCGAKAVCFAHRGELFCSESCDVQAEHHNISRIIREYAPEMSEGRRGWVERMLFRNPMAENWTDEQYKEFIREYRYK